MAAEDYRWLMQIAGDLAVRAAGEIRRRFMRAEAWLKDDNTWVTDVDHAAQAIILAGVSQYAGDHAVLAEEDLPEVAGRPQPGEARFCWVIDPLDGTHNFVRGAPIFGCSIAVFDEGRPVAAAVADVMTGIVYRAAAGHGAYANGRRLVMRDEPLGGRVVVAVPSGRESPTRGALLGSLSRYTLRNMGSSALHLSLVACGGIDAAFALEVKLWDWAAGWLLVREAGGRVVDLAGVDYERVELMGGDQPDLPYVAGAPWLVDELREIIVAAQDVGSAGV